MLDEDLPIWQQPLLRYFVSACAAVIIFVVMINLAGGFSDFVSQSRPSRAPATNNTRSNLITATSIPRVQLAPIHNVYYLVESQEHADALNSGKEVFPPSLDPNPTKRVVLIAETENDATQFNIELFNESFEQQLAGNSFTYELIKVRR